MRRKRPFVIQAKSAGKETGQKVLRYHTEPAAVMGVETTPTCMGSVDFFHYENGTLNAIGWAFDPTFASMGQPRIAFYQGTQKLQEASCTTIYRTDVANAIGNPDAESAGFSFLATVLAPAETSVFLEYGTAADTGRFLIGKIPGTRDQKELGIRDRRSEEYRKSPPFQTASCTQHKKGISTGSLSAEGGCDRAGLQRTGVF